MIMCRIYLLQEVTMIEFLYLTLPNDITYNNLKKPVDFSEDLQCFACWAWKQPLAIYSQNKKQKHTFHPQGVMVESVSNPTLEQRWKYFIITRGDSSRLYCTSYMFYQKSTLRVEQHSFFQLGFSLTSSQFYIPKCLIIKSQQPYFKLHTNLIKIHRELHQNTASSLHYSLKLASSQFHQQSVSIKQPYTGRKRNAPAIKKLASLKEFAGSKTSSADMMFNYFVDACNEPIVGEKIYFCPDDAMQILHLYSLPDSLYRFNYFFHVPISMANIAVILGAMLQEKQIIFVSSNQNSNLALMETLLEMIRPLKWDFLYVPNLPESMLDAAEHSFMPYMVGIHRNYYSQLSTRGRVVVHVDQDSVQMGEDKPEEMPQILVSMLLVKRVSTADTSYLEWERDLRVRSLLMISALLAQASTYRQSKSRYHKFYEYFFEESVMYSVFKNELYAQPNIEMNELAWMSLEHKLIKIQSSFRTLEMQARFPTLINNQAKWTNQYCAEHGKKSLKRLGSRNKLIGESQFQCELRSSVIQSTMGNKKSCVFRKGIAFVNKSTNSIQ